MFEATAIQELRRALRREGIWGQRGTRLLQDWRDHVHESTAQRVADGAPTETAEQAAWQALGDPHRLASHAAQELAQGSWFGRRPWLAGILLPLCVWIACMSLALYVVIFCLQDFAAGLSWPVSPGTLRAGELAFNWLPWLLSVTWLARLARTLPGGWKHYWITAVTLTLLAPCLHLEFHPPIHEIRGYFAVPISGIPGTIVGAILRWLQVLPDGPASSVFDYNSPWIQTAISCAGLAALRWWSRSSFERTPSRMA